MLISALAQVLTVVAGQLAVLPPTPEQLARRLQAVPRCGAVPTIPTAQARGAAPATIMADRIANAMRRAQEQFPNLRCQERLTK